MHRQRKDQGNHVEQEFYDDAAVQNFSPLPDQFQTSDPSIPSGKLYTASLVATTISPLGPNAMPTIFIPATTNSASCPSGEILTTPRRPRSAAATYRFPARSNAKPCGRPSPR